MEGHQNADDTEPSEEQKTARIVEERTNAMCKEFGYPMPRYCTRANVQALGTPFLDDVFVCSYPKSGTHLLKQIVHGIFIRGDAEQLKAEESLDLSDICPILEADPKVDHNAMTRPRVYHTHLRYGDVPKGGRIVYIVRDFLDVASSLFTFLSNLNKMPPEYTKASQVQAMMDGTFLSSGGSWDRHLLSFWKARNEDHVLIVKFEDLKADREGQITRIAKFLGVDLDAAAIARVADMSSFEYMKKAGDRIMGKEYLARIRGAPVHSEAYTLVAQGSVGSAASFDDETRAKVDAFWTEKVMPFVGAQSYNDLEVVPQSLMPYVGA